jgi:MoCo/4Fe-4S cofactor protein with predicted Tat translocation signal
MLDKCPGKHDVIEEARKQTSALTGKRYWRSVEEWANSPVVAELVQREFPFAASEWNDGASRRTFLTLMGASLALAGLQGCSKPSEDQKIVPYVKPPEGVTPGDALFYASAMPFRGYARPLLVTSREGRPVKVDGNDRHPASLGASDVFTQASLLQMYDPDRSQTVLQTSSIRSWSGFLASFNTFVDKKGGAGNVRLRILTETVTSPTLIDLIQRQLKARFPQMQWHVWEPFDCQNFRAGVSSGARPIYHFDKAKVVFSIDADFLAADPGSLAYARDFMNRRRVRQEEGKAPVALENRMYTVESTVTITGFNSDHRHAAKPSEVEAIARAVAAGVRGGGSAMIPAGAEKFVAALVADLQSSHGASLVIAGDSASPEMHRIAHELNVALGNDGSTVTYVARQEGNPDSMAALRADMKAGNVDALLIVGGNPAANTPADYGFDGELVNFSRDLNHFSAHLSLYDDETSFRVQWHVPEAHYLESWGDIRAYEGTVTLIQPLIAPLYDGRSAYEFIASVAGDTSITSREIVRNYWREQTKLNGAAFEDFWESAVERGFVPDSASPAATVTLPASAPAAATFTGSSNYEVVFRPDPCIWTGCYANNAWLQETPKPITKLTWGNALLMSLNTAKAMGIDVDHVGVSVGRNEYEEVEIHYGGNTVTGAVFPTPGHPDNCVTVYVGHGRSRAGKVGNDVGFDAYAIQTSQSIGWGGGVELKKPGTASTLATTQRQQLMDGRDMIRFATSIEDYKKQTDKIEQDETAKGGGRTVHLDLLPDWDYSKGFRWGMSIDTTACIGCNACVVACQAENNVPVVGKEQVIRERHMHWLRIDTYFEGPLDKPDEVEVGFQPVPCMHCEKAPCEIVCPVGATTHSAEGLNEMVYNRCVGTRYCSNNCPYKVRRFNFLQFNDNTIEVLKMSRNPEVTVRSRGVMEKCTYCVQRIDHARIEHKKLVAMASEATTDAQKAALEKRSHTVIRELQSACQQSCPTQAIVFGDMNDQTSEVYKLKGLEPSGNKSQSEENVFAMMDYGLLEELNTKPRTTYLPRLSNPNPAVKGGA